MVASKILQVLLTNLTIKLKKSEKLHKEPKMKRGDSLHPSLNNVPQGVVESRFNTVPHTSKGIKSPARSPDRDGSTGYTANAKALRVPEISLSRPPPPIVN